ncbi:MAG: glycosyltransferase [Planctomycetota bacterium]
MTLAILIPSKNRHAELARGLRTVLPMARRAGAEVIVCDQSPTPFVAPDVVRVLHRPELSGLPAARNALLAATTADVVLFLDDDSDVAKDVGTQLRTLAVHEPTVAAWGAVVEARSPCMRLAHRLLHLGCFRDVRRLTSRRVDRNTPELFGCCFAVRRSAALAVGGFDARLPGYALGEDRDFCWRLRDAGFHLRFSAVLRAHHRAAGGGNPALRPRLAYLRWWAARHGRGNPATVIHLVLVTLAWTLRKVRSKKAEG